MQAHGWYDMDDMIPRTFHTGQQNYCIDFYMESMKIYEIDWKKHPELSEHISFYNAFIHVFRIVFADPQKNTFSIYFFVKWSQGKLTMENC